MKSFYIKDDWKAPLLQNFHVNLKMLNILLDTLAI